MKVIGLSLSFCIREIISGDVEEKDVVKIVTGTCCRNIPEWERLFKIYSECYWDDDPEAVAVARRLLEADKLEQPRLDEDYLEPWGRVATPNYWRDA